MTQLKDLDGLAAGRIVAVNGPLATCEIDENIEVMQNEVAYVICDGTPLKSEIIRIRDRRIDMQVFESTSGLAVGDRVVFSGKLLSAELGPGILGKIFDGLQNPLSELENVQNFFLKRGQYLNALDQKATWMFTPTVEQGTTVKAGHYVGFVPEGMFRHNIMVPWNLQGSWEISKIKPAGLYTIDDRIALLKNEDGRERWITMKQEWPVKIPSRIYSERLLPERQILTQCRLIDIFFPLAEGGTACIPGPFGAGKTVLQQIISRYAEADVVIIVACGERAGEVVETIREFPHLEDPRTGKSLMDRTVIICNTSSMPVAAEGIHLYRRYIGRIFPPDRAESSVACRQHFKVGSGAQGIIRAHGRIERLLPWNAQALRQDLGLDVIFRDMAHGDAFLFEVAQVAILTSVSDLETINYRQAILNDCARNELIVRGIYQLAVEAIERERKEHWGFLSRSPGITLYRSIGALQMFVDILRRLRGMADDHADKFTSDGLSRLCSMLREELTDEYFGAIEAHLRRLTFRRGVLISAQLGKGNKGTNYVLRKPHEDRRNWLSRLLWPSAGGYTYQVHPRDEAGARALSELRDQGVNLVANALAQSTDHILSFFEMLRTELAFYIGCLNLRRRLAELGKPTCLPKAARVADRTLSFSGLYDLSLALSASHPVVGNDLAAHGKELFVIMGANSGGKSTFLRSIGQAQLMMQAGMFVAANGFAAELRNGLLTHFKREEDAAMESGKLDEELKRMSEIVDHIAPNSIVLFNESFAATNEREGSEIARQITTALVGGGVKVFFVTHLYEFAFRLHQTMPEAMFLTAERRSDGTRTFRIISGEPSQTSHGRDLYARVFGSEPSPTGVPRGTSELARLSA